MTLPLDTILCGDCLTVLKTLPDESVHSCVTSPPYYGLRDYGINIAAICKHSNTIPAIFIE